MHEKHIICPDCARTYPVSGSIFFCPECQGSLEVIFDYDRLRAGLTKEKLRQRPFDHLRYLELYPVGAVLSLGEGGTPLLRSKNLERELGLDFELWFKCEFMSVTGSFKDRGSSVEVARALEMGAKSCVCASTGNMGASVAAYCAAAGLDCSVFIPSDAAAPKIQQILAHGAGVSQVAGDYSRAALLAESAYEKEGKYLLGDYLHRREGTKSVGFEILDRLEDTDHIVCPVGNGVLLSAIWKSVEEFHTLGFIREKPKLAGIQAAGCSPVARAFEEGADIRPMPGRTIALAIECPDPLDGERALSALRESGGFAGTVTDGEILEARDMLARKEGMFAEPAGAAALAGLIKYRGEIPRGERVVCLVTGHGLKAPHTEIRGKVKKLGQPG